MPAGNMRAAILTMRDGEMSGGGAGNTVKADGTFTISNLDPGKYTLIADAFGAGPQRRLQSAPVDIEVAGMNIEHLELRMIPPFEVTGQLHFDDAQIRFPRRPRDLQDCRIMFRYPVAVRARSTYNRSRASVLVREARPRSARTTPSVWRECRRAIPRDAFLGAGLYRVGTGGLHRDGRRRPGCRQRRARRGGSVGELAHLRSLGHRE